MRLSRTMTKYPRTETGSTPLLLNLVVDSQSQAAQVGLAIRIAFAFAVDFGGSIIRQSTRLRCTTPL